MTVIISRAGLEDIDHLAANLRPSDAAEMKHCGLDPLQTREVMKSALSEGTVFAARVRGLAIMVFGLGPDGYVWALGTPDIEKNSMSFLRCCGKAVSALRDIAGVSLWTVAWRGNPLHLRWLKWCGFDDLGDHEPGRPLMLRPDHV